MHEAAGTQGPDDRHAVALQLQLWTNGTLEEYLPATTFGAPASS